MARRKYPEPWPLGLAVAFIVGTLAALVFFATQVEAPTDITPPAGTIPAQIPLDVSD